MTSVASAGPAASPLPIRGRVPGWLTLLLATACGLVAANIYYAQPLAGPISASLALTLAAILLDFGVTANGVLGQRAIYALDAAVRGRLNGLYMATFFAGGAVGSAFGGWAYAQGGWLLTSGIGLVPVLVALLAFSIEPKEDPR